MAEREFRSAQPLEEQAGDAALDGSSPAHYQATFKFAGVGLARVKLSGEFTDVNQHLCEMLGYVPEDLLG